MSRRGATLAAAALAILVYLGIAYLASGIDIPPDAPTAQSPWVRPFRVVASIGFALASLLHVPHLAGDFLAAILLGAILGAIFAAARHLLG